MDDSVAMGTPCDSATLQSPATARLEVRSSSTGPRDVDDTMSVSPSASTSNHAASDDATVHDSAEPSAEPTGQNRDNGHRRAVPSDEPVGQKKP
jgi:hypothetical protein